MFRLALDLNLHMWSLSENIYPEQIIALLFLEDVVNSGPGLWLVEARPDSFCFLSYNNLKYKQE